MEIGEFSFALELKQKVFDTPEQFLVFLDLGLVSPNSSNKTSFGLPLAGLGLVSEEIVILLGDAHKTGLVLPGFALALELQNKLMF